MSLTPGMRGRRVGERTSLAASREVYVSLGWESQELKGNERGGWWP